MSSFKSPEGRLVRALLREGVGFTAPERILSGLNSGQADERFEHLPHSITAVVAHLDFWQRWALDAMKGAPRPFPERAAEGWPVRLWEEARVSFLDGLAEAEALTEDMSVLESTFIPSTTPGNSYTVGPHSVGWALLDLAVHNAHHLGQVVTLRQLQGLWPPGKGGVTW